ncbi:hypothetical protein D3C73_837090 [compost metagenome]
MGVDKSFRIPGIVFHLAKGAAGEWSLVEVDSRQAQLKASGDKLDSLSGCYFGAGEELGVGDAFDQSLLLQGINFVFAGYVVDILEAAVCGKDGSGK